MRPSALRLRGYLLQELLSVSITSPKKENFIYRWRDQVGMTCVMGVGGTADVLAGKGEVRSYVDAEVGPEGFYRVMQEPGRMWKRYLVTNSQFGWLLLKAKLGLGDS